MLKIFGNFSRLLRYRSLWLYLFLMKLIFSFLLVVPFFLESNGRLASSVHSGSLITDWNIGVLVELFTKQSELPVAFLLFIFAGGTIFAVLMQFLNGGIYFQIVSGEKEVIGRREFFAECGANFAMHLKIALFMMVVYLVLLPASLFLINMIGVAGQSLMGAAALVFLLIKGGIIFLIFLAASIFSDSVRAASAAHPDWPFKEILKSGSVFFRPNMTKALGIFLVTYVPFVLIWIAAESLSWGAVGLFGGMAGIVVEFLLFQVSSFARTGQKLWYLINFGLKYKDADPGRFLPEQVQLELD
ncbi:membrane hypothetical protein [Candidatus Zixiibacteriota bacterium]|nr:membrane hypothetical protein [candidate division Zixibacteria bacterium]